MSNLIMAILWILTIAVAIAILFMAWKEKLNYEKIIKTEKEICDEQADILVKEQELLDRIEKARKTISE